MKKIYLIILLAVSMSFAIKTVMEDFSQGSCSEFSPVFNISTARTNGVNGFKVYVYFSVDSENDKPELLTKRINIDQKRVRMDPVTSHVYKVTLDYSDYNLPSNDRLFTGGELFRPFTVTLKNGSVTHCLRPYPWGKNHHNFVIESKNRTVLEGKHPNFRSRIGLPTTSPSQCEGGSSSAYPNEPTIYIRLDTEDSDGATKIKKGDKSPNGITLSNSSIRFTYCVYEFSELPRAPYDYAVLKLDEQCPTGTYPVKRHHDCENSNPDNQGFGPMWPNKIGSDADLEYCFVPKASNSTLVYPFAGLLSNATKTSIFANVSNSNLAHSEIYIDDENKKNKNSWNYYNAGWLKDRIEAIMSGDKNTYYHVVKWKGTYLNKSADVEVAESPISVENSLVAAVPQAPAIKGLDRSAVAVELKSEGNVKISIVNVNGSVIANIAQESLQPGVHQIKWNSGMVPSGRYIVKIEQNGMVNAKNVILK